MLTFELDGRKHRIAWQHETDPEAIDDLIFKLGPEACYMAGLPTRPYWQKDGLIVCYIAYTQCRIERWDVHGEGQAEDWGVVATGLAFCRNDEPVFSKQAGRKISLTKALRVFPQPTRAAIWRDYHQIWPLKKKKDTPEVKALKEQLAEALLQIKAMERVSDQVG
jgi:hypothetical protein